MGDVAGDALAQWVAGLLPDHPELGEQFARAQADSPERINNAYREIFAGYTMNAEDIVRPTVLLDTDQVYNGTVIAKNIYFISYCAHHFLPFFGHVDLAYDPGRMIVGLGKLPRLVDFRARRLQIQEFLARDLVSDLMNVVGARGAFAQVTAKHLCMCARGPSQPGSSVTAIHRDGSLRHWVEISKAQE